jgi:hypothetical protein
LYREKNVTRSSTASRTVRLFFVKGFMAWPYRHQSFFYRIQISEGMVEGRPCHILYLAGCTTAAVFFHASISVEAIPHLLYRIVAGVPWWPLPTYHDFTNNLSHKLLGWKFHTGAYLFWAGWLVIIALGYLEKKKQPIV